MTYEWAIVGGGIAGISLAEILTREGHSVILIEKEEKLASVTTADFHEWIHTGSLYSLLPDKALTMRYLLGAIDDILEYYQSYERMNLQPTESGLNIGESGWFETNYIQFRFKTRHIHFAWIFIAARANYLIDKIRTHDWLRRRGGEINQELKHKYKNIRNKLWEVVRSKDKFYTVVTTDFTAQSRMILGDLIITAMKNGLEISLSNSVKKISNSKNVKKLQTDKGEILAQKVIVTSGKHTSDFFDAKVTTTYAPIAVVSNLSKDCPSFVELDYYPKNSINIVTKGNGIGMVGGISLKNKSECESYINKVLEKHKKYEPKMKVLDTYIGLKNEVTFKNQNRNYLYHILEQEKNVWAIIPGKFTLGFSLAPEFYRKVYHRNPKKVFKTYYNDKKAQKFVSKMTWQKIVDKSLGERKNGND